MVGESNPNVLLIQIYAFSFAELKISEFEISRVDCSHIIIFTLECFPLLLFLNKFVIPIKICIKNDVLMFGHMLKSSRRDDSSRWSGILDLVGRWMGIIEIKIRI